MKDVISLPLETPGPGLDSKYRLAVVAAQRAVQISKLGRFQSSRGYRKATSEAIAEFQEGIVPFFVGEKAIEARHKDEETYKQLLSEARESYVDEEGNAVFGPSGAPRMHQPRQAAPAPAPEAPAPLFPESADSE
ncbi:MAG: DNA-directed RNA polymerase subunit omega [Nitrospirota bacterium]|nr:DNA-directed RNA polymerase subunit omega [Nitrospirota bacterium]